MAFSEADKFRHTLFITARVRSTREGNIYTWECPVCSHCGGGRGGGGEGGYPIPGLARGGTLSHVWWGGVPHPRSGGLPPSRPGVPPNLRWGTPQTWDGVPPQTWDGVTPRTWDGVPPWTWDGVLPPPPQHSEHLIRGGRYVSCVHAGGLS